MLTSLSTAIVTLFNVNGNRLAYKLNDGGKDTIGHGSMKELHATYHIQGDNQKPEYIIVQSSGIDAICIAAVTVTHPTSSDTYAFLPGEVGKVCGDWDPDNDYAWSNSGAVVQFKGPEGNTAEARPKCMWIDSADNKNVAATSWKGFQVHLPDFKMDNSKFKTWEGDPYHMCGSKARFGVYKALNEYSELDVIGTYRVGTNTAFVVCPQVFETPPAQGALLPLPEVSTCVPGVAPDKSGKFEVNICKDGRLDAYGKNKLFQSFGRQPRAQCKGNRAAKERRRLDLSQKFSEANKSAIQKRFTGQLIKSRDSGQSAVETCNSRNSIGPNFYSYHEGQLCDMERRKLYPRCEASDETECFDE
jgi:hypothetical protein